MLLYLAADNANGIDLSTLELLNEPLGSLLEFSEEKFWIVFEDDASIAQFISRCVPIIVYTVVRILRRFIPDPLAPLHACYNSKILLLFTRRILSTQLPSILSTTPRPDPGPSVHDRVCSRASGPHRPHKVR